MSFFYPTFLFALGVIALPIIIHLLNLSRHKKIYFSNVALLREVQQQKQRVNRLRDRLILLCRVLALTFLVLAFAQPYLPKLQGTPLKKENLVGIYVDNSYSMEQVNEQGALLEQAKQHAREVVQAFGRSDKFILLTNDFEPRHAHAVNADKALQLIDEIKSGPAVKDLPAIYSRQKDLLNRSDANRHLFVISDFSKNQFRFQQVPADTTVATRLVKLDAGVPQNVYLDTCWFNVPWHQSGGRELLTARVVNKSEKALENFPLRLFIDGQQRSITPVNAAPGQTTEVQLGFTNLKNGNHRLELKLNDYPVTFDDVFYVSQYIAPAIKILEIFEDPAAGPLQNVYGNDSVFAYTRLPYRSLDYSVLGGYSLVILNGLNAPSSGLVQELKKYTSGGGDVFITMSKTADTEAWKNFLPALGLPLFMGTDTARTALDGFNHKHPLYDGVFSGKPAGIKLPDAGFRYRFPVRMATGMEPIMTLPGDMMYLGVKQSGKGKIYLMGSLPDGEYGNFTGHALFVPTMYRMAFMSVDANPSFYWLGRSNTLELPGSTPAGESVYHLMAANGSNDIIPRLSNRGGKPALVAGEQLRDPGFYRIVLGKETLGETAFNIDRSESDFESYDAGELQEIIGRNGLESFSLLEPQKKGIGQLLSEEKAGTRLWKICLTAALVFLLAEILLIQFWKTDKP